jgi:hypothetical protein
MFPAAVHEGKPVLQAIVQHLGGGHNSGSQNHQLNPRIRGRRKVDDGQNLLSVSRIGRALTLNLSAEIHSSHVIQRADVADYLKILRLEVYRVFTLEQGMKANAGELAIIVLVYLRM